MNSEFFQIAYLPYWLIGVIVVLIIININLIVHIGRLRKKNEANDARYQILKQDVDKDYLKSLQSKLNPHLLKNILNSIQAHSYQTYFAIDKLSNVMDYILYESHKYYVSPKDEIEFSKNLIEINKIKLSPLFELKVKFKVNENEPLYHQQLLSPLICADLIENAFKHADLQGVNSFISVIFEFNNNTFCLTVANSISPKTPLKKERKGIGMDTLKQRLQIVYAENYKLDSFVENNVYITHLKIDLFAHKVKMLTA